MTTEEAQVIVEAAEELETFDVAEIERETNAIDIGGYGDTDNERLLARYLRRMGQLNDEAKRLKEWHERLKSRIEAQRKGLEYVYSALAEQAARELLVGSKRKSISTPWGTAGFRKQAAKLIVQDEAKVLANEAFVRVKKELNKTALNEHFKSTGDVPDGCDVEPECEKFYAK